VAAASRYGLAVPTARGAADANTGPQRIAWFQRLLGLCDGKTLVDLGAGHGKFSIVAADLGWQVTAIDARGDRYPEDPRITWQVGDVREAPVADFDVVACLGLFYHLTVDDQIDLLARCAGRPIILDTHVANDAKSQFTLSDEVTLRGYRGKLYVEGDQAVHSTASWGNDESFWPRTRALYRMLNDHGFEVLTASPWYLPSRTFFLCLPR